jgi:tetratricopeptide (TPR) repeat protein
MRHKTLASSRRRTGWTRLFRSPGNGGCLLGLGFLLTLTVNAQNTPTNAQKKPTPDKEMDRVQAMISQAKTDAEKFSKSGGKPSDANNPNLKWSAALWQYRETHPGTPATVIATIEALRLLNRADRLSELQKKADALKADDAAWKQVLYVLMSAASKSKDYSYLISKAEALAQSAVDPEIKAQARFNIGDAYWKTKDTDRARRAFQAVVAEYPQTRWAQEAEGNLWEIEFLNPGQPAPGFERTSLNGDPISLARFKGKVVVLKFWGTY